MTTPDAQLEACYRQHFPMIRAKCRRMLDDPEEARDVAQETFIRLWQKPDLLTAPVPVRVAWMYRTCMHLAIDRLRRVKTRLQLAPVASDDAVIEPDTVIAHRRLLKQVATALSVDELEALILSRIDGLTQAEVAQVTKSSERTVRRVLSRVDVQLAALTAVAHV